MSHERSGVSRRTLLAASGSVLLGAFVACESAAARAESAAPAAVTVYPVTSDRVAVVATIDGPGRLSVSANGHTVDAVAAGGVAVVTMPVATSSTTPLRVTVPTKPASGMTTSGAEQNLVHLPAGECVITADTRDDSLRASLLRVVNKRIALTEKDAPKHLAAVGAYQVDSRLQEPVQHLRDAARRANLALDVISGYRSFATQRTLYDEYEKRDGQQAADTYSARPGHSEHQLGLAIDVRGGPNDHELQEAFKDTPTGRWVSAHAHEHGFIVRYQQKDQHETGYRPEPWHLRYVGEDVAKHLHARHDVSTLEQLFGLPAAPSY